MNTIAQSKNLFVVLLTYQVPLAQIDQHRPAHMAFLDKYYAAGVFIVSGGQVPRTGGVILAKCESKEQLKQILAQDPFASHHLATYEIYEFAPTKCAEVFQIILL